jgi:hypothetical protein
MTIYVLILACAGYCTDHQATLYFATLEGCERYAEGAYHVIEPCHLPELTDEPGAKELPGPYPPTPG